MPRILPGRAPVAEGRVTASPSTARTASAANTSASRASGSTPTAEEGRDLSARSDGVHRLLDDAFEAVPALRETAFEEVAVGIRPATPDGRPAVGPGRLDGLVWAVGGYRHGVLLTPWAADVVVESIAASADVPEHCRPDRFADREAACA